MEEIKEKKKSLKRAKGQEFLYLRIDLIADRASNLYKDGFSEIYFKMTTEEYEQVKLLISLNEITEKHNITNKKDMDAHRRRERSYRDIVHIKQYCKVVGIYKFDINKNILKDDIPGEIRKYCYEFKDKPLSHFRVDDVF